MAKLITLSDKKISIGLHIIAWIIIISIPIYLNTVFNQGETHHLYRFSLHALSAILIFYIGYLWLIPRFFLRERKITYVLILIGIILATYFLSDFINDRYLFDAVMEARLKGAVNNLANNGPGKPPPNEIFGFYNHILLSILISGFAMGLGVMDKLKTNEKKQKELEKEKLNSELAFLKNQVSPHFFFNTLNNIYSLIRIDGLMAQDSVLKLSKLMRYLLYESENGQTQMSSEIEFMTNYIDLMKLRLSQKVRLEVDFPKEFKDFSVPPLLFVAFVENAFKHGVSFSAQSFITIGMKFEDKEIHFFTENSLGQPPRAEDLQHSGIGLENVKKRLNLLFADQYELKIDRKVSSFRVDLRIRNERMTT